MTPTYAIVIPTYRRAESLAECLETVCALDYPKDAIEVVIIDNGGLEHTRAAADPFHDRLRIRYLVNAKNRGYGFSVNRGIVESTGDRVLLLNDDARLMPDLLRQCDALLATDPSIGCVGCRAIEQGYVHIGTEIGVLLTSGIVVGNFDIDCGTPIEVEHVYGFCYVFTREAVRRAGLNDMTLLAQPYSSGNCIETDHCLSIRRAGLKVMYHPGMVARHLAKPRPDMSEISLRWHMNAIRNPLYLYLKHFGPFGKRCAALRWTFSRHLGLWSMLRKPNRANVEYFTNGVRAKASAWGHWIKYLAKPNHGFDSEAAVRALLEADARELTNLTTAGAASRGGR
jgi:GT2 family glycosyltransferase